MLRQFNKKCVPVSNNIQLYNTPFEDCCLMVSCPKETYISIGSEWSVCLPCHFRTLSQKSSFTDIHQLKNDLELAHKKIMTKQRNEVTLNGMYELEKSIDHCSNLLPKLRYNPFLHSLCPCGQKIKRDFSMVEESHNLHCKECSSHFCSNCGQFGHNTHGKMSCKEFSCYKEKYANSSTRHLLQDFVSAFNKQENHANLVEAYNFAQSHEDGAFMCPYSGSLEMARSYEDLCFDENDSRRIIPQSMTQEQWINSDLRCRSNCQPQVHSDCHNVVCGGTAEDKRREFGNHQIKHFCGRLLNATKCPKFNLDAEKPDSSKFLDAFKHLIVSDKCQTCDQCRKEVSTFCSKCIDPSCPLGGMNICASCVHDAFIEDAVEDFVSITCNGLTFEFKPYGLMHNGAPIYKGMFCHCGSSHSTAEKYLLKSQNGYWIICNPRDRLDLNNVSDKLEYAFTFSDFVPNYTFESEMNIRGRNLVSVLVHLSTGSEQEKRRQQFKKNFRFCCKADHYRLCDKKQEQVVKDTIEDMYQKIIISRINSAARRYLARKVFLQVKSHAVLIQSHVRRYLLKNKIMFLKALVKLQRLCKYKIKVKSSATKMIGFFKIIKAKKLRSLIASTLTNGKRCREWGRDPRPGMGCLGNGFARVPCRACQQNRCKGRFCNGDGTANIKCRGCGPKLNDRQCRDCGDRFTPVQSFHRICRRCHRYNATGHF